jgi:hypothetical protein
MSSGPCVLIGNRCIQVIVIGESQKNDVGLGHHLTDSGGQVLGVSEIDEAPVKIDHAIVAGGLVRFTTGEAEQLVAQLPKGVCFPHPDDYVKLLISMLPAWKEWCRPNERAPTR